MDSKRKTDSQIKTACEELESMLRAFDGAESETRLLEADRERKEQQETIDRIKRQIAELS